MIVEVTDIYCHRNDMQWRSKLDNWEGGYSYIRVHRPPERSILEETNCA